MHVVSGRGVISSCTLKSLKGQKQQQQQHQHINNSSHPVLTAPRDQRIVVVFAAFLPSFVRVAVGKDTATNLISSHRNMSLLLLPLPPRRGGEQSTRACIANDGGWRRSQNTQRSDEKSNFYGIY